VSSRYYNLDLLTGRVNKAQQTDPIAEWYQRIGSRILRQHYSAKRRQRDKQSARIIESMIGSFTAVLHTAEEGHALTDVRSASLRTGENKIIQKYGTFYCAKVVRFLYMILYDLNHEAHRVKLPIPYLYELFFPFMNEDSYLLSRKTFLPLGQ
jgi:hypothetical protein